MKIEVDITPKEMAELIGVLQVQPTVDVDEVTRTIGAILQRSAASYGHTLGEKRQ